MERDKHLRIYKYSERCYDRTYAQKVFRSSRKLTQKQTLTKQERAILGSSLQRINEKFDELADTILTP